MTSIANLFIHDCFAGYLIFSEFLDGRSCVNHQPELLSIHRRCITEIFSCIRREWVNARVCWRTLDIPRYLLNFLFWCKTSIFVYQHVIDLDHQTQRRSLSIRAERFYLFCVTPSRSYWRWFSVKVRWDLEVNLQVLFWEILTRWMTKKELWWKVFRGVFFFSIHCHRDNICNWKKIPFRLSSSFALLSGDFSA